MNTLNTKAWFGLFGITVVMGLLLFIPAATLKYIQAWGFLAIFFTASSYIVQYLIKNDPALLKRRLSVGASAEKELTQKIIMRVFSISSIVLLIVPAFDHRFGWSTVPLYGTIFGDILIISGFYIIFLVFRVNTFASATIEIINGQKVISSGPYALVRHPMYVGALILLIGTPLALGSYWGFLVLAGLIPTLIVRLLHEDKFLARHLTGYREYQKKVRWRLIPGVF